MNDDGQLRIKAISAIQWAYENRQDLVEIVYSSADINEAKSRVSEAAGISIELADMCIAMPIHRLTEISRSRVARERDELERYQRSLGNGQ